MRNPGSILRECERLLRHPPVHIRIVELDGDHSARSNFNLTPAGQPAGDEPIQLLVDTTQIGLIPATLHELLHIVFYTAHADLSSDLDETIIRALTDELFRKKYFTPARLNRWRRLIDQAITRSPAP